MTKQDNFYLTVESDSFFERNKKLNNQFLDNFKSKKIRTRKEQIYNLIQKKNKIKNKTKG